MFTQDFIRVLTEQRGGAHATTLPIKPESTPHLPEAAPGWVVHRHQHLVRERVRVVQQVADAAMHGRDRDVLGARQGKQLVPRLRRDPDAVPVPSQASSTVPRSVRGLTERPLIIYFPWHPCYAAAKAALKCGAHGLQVQAVIYVIWLRRGH